MPDDPIYGVVHRGSTHVGYREANGSLWSPLHFGRPTNILSFDREEAFALISEPGRPLAGHSELPQKVWLPDWQNSCQDAEIALNGPIQPCNVYALLGSLLRAYKRSEARISHGLTQENLKHARFLLRQAQRYLIALSKPRTLQVYPALSWEQSVTDVERDIARFEATINVLKDQIENINNERRRSLEEFIRGPLAACYGRLFGRRPSRKWRLEGPFVSFAQRFLTIVGHPATPATIVSALKGRSRKKPTSRNTQGSRRKR